MIFIGENSAESLHITLQLKGIEHLQEPQVVFYTIHFNRFYKQQNVYENCGKKTLSALCSTQIGFKHFVNWSWSFISKIGQPIGNKSSFRENTEKSLEFRLVNFRSISNKYNFWNRSFDLQPWRGQFRPVGKGGGGGLQGGLAWVETNSSVYTFHENYPGILLD